MSRIEKGSDVVSQMVKMKKEVKEEVKRTGKRHRPAVGCCLIFLLVVFVCVGWIVWSLAATGLVFRPDGYLARAAYHVPTPREFVKPSVPVETVLESELSSELASRLQASGGNLSDRSISVTITQND